MPPLRNTGTGPEAEDPEYAGRYLLEGRLGSGGMGVVHLARSPSGLRLAVKVVHAEYAADPEFRARFRQEVTAARRVSGAFTAPVVDADPDCDRPWMATLCISGPTLAERIKRNGPLAPDEVRRLAAGLAEALRDIHRAGVVHRDLKPSNVLLAEDGPKVIDFGISRPYDSELRTETGKLVGTPPFMAPEQFQRPRQVGPAADVFALASLLVHASTGRGPFESESPYIVAYQVVHDEPDLTGVPEDLMPLIRSCLAKEPADRPTPDAIMAGLPRLAHVPLARSEPTPEPPRVDTPVTHAREVAGRAGPGTGRRKRVLWLVTAGVTAVAMGAGAKWVMSESSGQAGALESRPTGAAVAWQPWRAPLLEHPGGPAVAHPGFCTYAKSALYCSASGLHAARIDPLSGKVTWRRTAGGGGAGADPPPAPVVSGGLVLALSPNGRQLSAFDPATGEQRWSRDVSAHIGRIYHASDTVLLVASDGTVTALDSHTNKERWHHTLPGHHSPVFTSYRGGPVYATSLAPDGRSTHVIAVDPVRGTTLWQWTASGNLTTAGADEDGVLLLTATDADQRVSTVVRYDPAAGRETRVPLDRPVNATSTVARDDVVYVLSADGGLTAVDTGGHGRQLWRLETSVANASPLVADEGRLYFSAADGRLLAVDSARGTLLGQTSPRPAEAGRGFPGVLPAPVAADGKVFGSAPDGTVFAVDAAEPDEWR